MPRKPAEAFKARTFAFAVGVFVVSYAPKPAWAGEDDLTLDLGASSIELRRIPKGTFMQGSPPTEVGREQDEVQHEVTLSHVFWIGRVPVTRAQFSRFVTETHFATDAEKGQVGGFGWDGHTLVQKKEFTWRNPGFPQKDEDPVVLVSFADANAYAAWASRKSGRRVRLPTEAEWEYAARGGTTTPWFAANKDDEALALGWYKANAAYKTHPVGSKKANAFGLFDMGGDAFQWCRDVYAPYPTGPLTDPENTTPAAGEAERRVLRGGSWLRDAKRGRSAARHKNTPGGRTADIGFRVAMDEDAPPSAAPSEVPPPSPAVISSAPSGVLDADASASAVPLVPRTTEGSPWSLVLAPFAGAAIVIAWVMARRKRGGASVAPLPVAHEGRAALAVPAPPLLEPEEIEEIEEEPSPGPPPLPSASRQSAAKIAVPPPVPPPSSRNLPVASPAPPPSSRAQPPSSPRSSSPALPPALPSSSSKIAAARAAMPPPANPFSLSRFTPISPATPFSPVSLAPSSPFAPSPSAAPPSNEMPSSPPSMVPPSSPFAPKSSDERPSSPPSMVPPWSPFAPTPSFSNEAEMPSMVPPNSPFAPAPSAAPPAPSSPFALSPSAPPPTTPEPEVTSEMAEVEASMRKSIAEGLVALTGEDVTKSETGAESAEVASATTSDKDES